ncbi:regulator of nonsense transcripts, putative [Plasmodium relictum]|uniref:Regulator of nonsense transcripts, putative n=1 Tax=Plasmodium relictum TaxID=85471 RepID=A0A1J1H3X6_PLARL|nr:regulator of nonsense transcripts, putative [Plasmodium relictum]CRG99607.1 regulator of nonsense transcripts, putative [Plasmodium relictum]
MDNTFDYSQIDIDDFDEFNDFCNIRDKKKKKDSYFSADYDENNKKGTDSTKNKEGVRKSKKEKSHKKNKKNSKSTNYSYSSNEKRLDNVEENEEYDSLYKKKKKNYKNNQYLNSNNLQNNLDSVIEKSSYDDNKSNKYMENLKEDYDIGKKKSYEENNKKYINDSNNNNNNSNSKSKNNKNKEKLKYYRCRYCEIDSIDSVVQCNNCNRWFCNGSYGTCGSHIVTHLVRSKHKEIKLHKNSLLGETILECYNCGCRNVFLLGFLPTSEEGVVVIICRDPCLANCISLNEKNITKNENKSIIKEEGEEKEEKDKEDEDENSEEDSTNKRKNEISVSDENEYSDLNEQEKNKIGDNYINNERNEINNNKKKFNESEERNKINNKEKINSCDNEDGKKKKKKEKKSNNNNIYNNLEELGNIKDWNLKKWQPLIEDRSFLDWLVSIPSTEEAEKKGKLATSYNVNKLEELWKNKKDVYIDELDLEILNDEPIKVELKYEDAHHYQSIFAPLVQLEADYDKSIKEGQKQANVTVRWDVGLNKKRYAHFIYVKEESELRLVAGDELKLSYTYPNGKVWSCEGHISRLHNTEEIALELRILGTADGPWVDNITTGFTVEFVWKSTAYDRMQLALNEFALNSYSLSGFLYHKLLGHDISEDSLEYNKNNFYKQMQKKVMSIRNYSAPNLAPLNHSQIDAIKKSLLSPLSLIQGPPGTGKTLTCATLVYHLSKMNMGKVLVTAPSNVAVDQLSVRIHRSGLKVVRLCAKSRESVPSVADYLYLHNQMKLLKTDIGEELNKLLELKEEVGELSQKDERRLKKLISYAEHEILIAADVICATCVGAMDKRLKKFRFRQVLVDEATQSTEPECLVPLVTGAKQIVLVGDHCQLGPIIVCKKAANAGLGKSLFERLVMLGITPFRLEVQYRMHPALSEFPSYVFYDGSLQNGITLKEREYPLKDFPWPNPKCPMFFYNSTGLEEMSASGTSYLNRSEASNMEKLVRTLLKCGLKPNQIGVITPYEGQRAYITSLFQKNISFQHSAEIEVASVDAFQGREKDFILLSCVRSNKKLGIGFLNDPRRLNVALTRAKYGLIICGNAKVLSRHHFISKEKINSNETITNVNSVWINLLSQFKKKDLIVEGCLSNLKPVNINIPTPTKLPSRYTNFNYFQNYEKEKNKISNTSHNRKYNSNNNNNSFINVNLSNNSYCSDSIINKDFFSYINKHGNKNIFNSYINNLSQLSQFNDYSIDTKNFLTENNKNYDMSIPPNNNFSTHNLLYYNNQSEDKNVSNNSLDLNNKESYDNSVSKNYDMFFPYLFYYKNNQNNGSIPYIYLNEKNESTQSTTNKKFKNNILSNSPIQNMMSQGSSMIFDDFKLNCDNTQQLSQNTQFT